MQSLKEFLASHDPCIGLFISIPDPVMPELAKAAGFDFIRIDNEHYPFNYSQLADIIRIGTLIDLPVHVRVANLDDITKILDYGASGIVVPNCDSVERVREAVNAAKYYPLGKRGMGGIGRAVRLSGLSFPEYIKKANDSIALTIQIENIKALDQIDEMLSIPGVDLVATGLGDLSQSAGIPGYISDPMILKTEEIIVSKTIEHGLQPSARVPSRKRMEELYKIGQRFFPVGSDEVLLLNAMKNRVAEFKSSMHTTC